MASPVLYAVAAFELLVLAAIIFPPEQFINRPAQLAGKLVKAFSRPRPKHHSKAAKDSKEPAEPTIRTFIGFSLHADLQTRLWGKLQEWKKAGRVDGKLEERAKLHVTLKFIGSMPESATHPLLQELRADLAASRPLTVRIMGIGSFKSFRKFTVWAGVEEEAKGSLQELAASIDKVVYRQGLAQLDRRRLRPHVTLARKARNWAQLLKSEELAFGEMPVSCITLFESRSGRYLPLGTVDLAAEASDNVMNLAADIGGVCGLESNLLPPALQPSTFLSVQLDGKTSSA